MVHFYLDNMLWYIMRRSKWYRRKGWSNWTCFQMLRSKLKLREKVAKVWKAKTTPCLALFLYIRQQKCWGIFFTRPHGSRWVRPSGSMNQLFNLLGSSLLDELVWDAKVVVATWALASSGAARALGSSLVVCNPLEGPPRHTPAHQNLLITG